jgi:hypothetical protein
MKRILIAPEHTTFKERIFWPYNASCSNCESYTSFLTATDSFTVLQKFAS